MTACILALHRLDLPVAHRLAAQLRQGDEPLAQVAVVDPVLHNHALVTDQGPVQLIRLPDCDVVRGASARAWAAARLVQDEADEVLGAWLPEAADSGWLMHWLRQLHLSAFGFQQVARSLIPLLSGRRVLLLLPGHPHRQGYHSFLPALMVSAVLRQGGVKVELFENAMPGWEARTLPDARVLAGAPAPDAEGEGADHCGDAVDCLVHLPTCFYDAALFARGIAEAGWCALNLPSQLHDVALDGLPRTGLTSRAVMLERLDAGRRSRLEAMLDRLGQRLTPHFQRLLGGSKVALQQVSALVDACRDNALVFHALEDRFGDRPPHTLVISNHDAGQHGGVFSYARRHDMRVWLLPHSKVVNLPVPVRGLRLKCLHHAIQGGPILDLDGNAVPSGVLDFEQPIAIPARRCRPLQTVGIVLNGLSVNGMAMMGLTTDLEGLKRVLHTCDSLGLSARVRCRPNESAMALLTSALGLDLNALIAHQSGTLVEFAQDCDVVLGFDQPTSGAGELLANNLPMAQVTTRALAPEEWRLVSQQQVPCWSVDEAVWHLNSWSQRPDALWRFARRQACDHLSAAREARPLVAWLTESAQACV